MIRTQRIRRISPTRRPSARRQANETRHGARRAEPATNARRSAALPVPRRDVPAKPAKRRRARHLRLVVANVRPRWRRPVVKPTLRLIRGRAPLLALPPRRPAPAQTRAVQPEPRSRVAQLAFVVAMTAIGLVALATSLGQLFARGM